MIDDVLQGIGAALKDEFGSDIRVTAENTEQGLSGPCFFVQLIKPQDEPFPSHVTRWVQPFDVIYFPADGEGLQAMYTIARRGIAALQIIEIGDRKTRGTQFSYQVVDDVLHIFVNYDLFVRTEPEKNPMETIDTNVGVKP